MFNGISTLTMSYSAKTGVNRNEGLDRIDQKTRLCSNEDSKSK